MISKKDKEAIQKNKKLIEEQVAATKKLDLGLDADQSSQQSPEASSSFDGFIKDVEPSPLEDK